MNFLLLNTELLISIQINVLYVQSGIPWESEIIQSIPSGYKQLKKMLLQFTEGKYMQALISPTCLVKGLP